MSLVLHSRYFMVAEYSIASNRSHITAPYRSDTIPDNWGLLPYRRRIIAVSKSHLSSMVNKGADISGSWSPCPCSEDEQSDRRTDQGGARSVYSGADEVCDVHFLTSSTLIAWFSKDLEHVQGRICTHPAQGAEHH